MIFSTIDEQNLVTLIGRALPQSRGACCDNECNSYICTREKGHEGPHVAHVREFEAVAIWGEYDFAYAIGEKRRLAEIAKDDFEKGRYS